MKRLLAALLFTVAAAAALPATAQKTVTFAYQDMTTPQVAVLAAVEGVTAALPATGDAAALAKMAVQGLISGAIVEGPLTVDSALSAAVARANGIESKIAGQADVLIVPSLESGAMMLQLLTAMSL